MTEPFKGGQRFFRGLIIALLITLALTALGAVLNTRRTLFSYLWAFSYWAGMSGTSLIALALFHAANARWMIVLRRVLEVMSLTAIVFIPLFIPIAWGLSQIYIWVHPPENLGEHALHLLHLKQPYLNPPFFIIRTVVYLAAWMVVGSLLYRWSTRQDDSGAVELTWKQRSLGTGSLPLLALTFTFAAVDWLMSLSPLWQSTIFGVYFFAGSFLASLALLTLIAVNGNRDRLFGMPLTGSHFHSLGKLLLAFVAFWAYIAFSQYLLIWIGNLPEEVPWYLERTRTGWKATAVALGIGHFAIPFLFLLSRRLKFQPKALAATAVWILFMHAVDLYWVILPAFDATHPRFAWTDITAFVALGSAAFLFGLWMLRGRNPFPVRDPFLLESQRYHA